MLRWSGSRWQKANQIWETNGLRLMQISDRLTCLSCGQTNRVPVAKFSAGPKCAICGGKLVSGDVATLDLRVHDKAVQSDDLLLVVDYWAPWCGPCKMMAPEYAKAAIALKGKARLAKIDTEQFPNISQRLQIRGIPLLILYTNGREVERLSGAQSSSQVEAFVRQKM